MRGGIMGSTVLLGLAFGLSGCDEGPQRADEAQGGPELHVEAEGVLPEVGTSPSDVAEAQPRALFMAGVALEGAESRGAWIAEGPQPARISDAEWAQWAGVTTRGDFGGDGQGLVVATPEFDLDDRAALHHVVDGQARFFTVVSHDGVSDLAAGDLDGDGRDELVVVTGDAAWVHDDATTGFERLGGFPAGFARIDAAGRTEWVRGRDLRAEVGDVTGDGTADLVLAGVGPRDEALLVVWPGSADSEWGFAPDDRMGATLAADSYLPAVDAVDLTVSDVDHDGRAEVALAAVTAAATTASRRHLHLSLARVEDGTLSLGPATAFARLASPGVGRSANAHLRAVQITSAQLSPDTSRTLVVDNHLFDLEDGALVHRGEWIWDGLFTTAPLGQPIDCEGDADTNAGDLSGAADYQIATGDFDDDGLDELAVVGVGMCAVGIFEGYAEGGRLSRVLPLTMEVARGDAVSMTDLALEP